MNNQTNFLVEQFVARTLPKAHWTHEAHLRVGLWHVLNHGASDALTLLRERIRAYNESVGTKNSETSGYHETITQFYVLMICKFLRESDRHLPVDELSTLLLADYGERELALQYYSRELLFSIRARLNWVEPDKQLI
jgi:hypothetical protein